MSGMGWNTARWRKVCVARHNRNLTKPTDHHQLSSGARTAKPNSVRRPFARQTFLSAFLNVSDCKLSLHIPPIVWTRKGPNHLPPTGAVGRGFARFSEVFTDKNNTGAKRMASQTTHKTYEPRTIYIRKSIITIIFFQIFRDNSLFGGHGAKSALFSLHAFKRQFSRLFRRSSTTVLRSTNHPPPRPLPLKLPVILSVCSGATVSAVLNLTRNRVAAYEFRSPVFTRQKTFFTLTV